MKKRFLAITLALALCMGLAIPAFAADEPEAKPVTVDGITLSDVVITDKYETFPAETFDFPEGFYNMGMIGFLREETEEYGYETFGTYIVPDDAVITFDLTKDSDAVVNGYTLKETEDSSASGNCYDAAYTGGILPENPEESITLTKSQLDGELQEFIPEYDLLVCRVGEGDWVFVMFESKAAALVGGDDPAPAFTDVDEDAYYAAPVAWAVENKVTNGATETTFEPETTCTQVQILTFLYRAADEPETEAELPVDIEGKNVDYAKGALCWAAEKGMIDETFDVAADCTRADAVSFIWQAFDKPEADKSEFKDVDAEAAYAAAVDWAVANGITNGTDMEAGEFSPDVICTRGQIVTFLHRAYVEEARLTVEK